MTEKQPRPGASAEARGAGDRTVLGGANDLQNRNEGGRTQAWWHACRNLVVHCYHGDAVLAALRMLCPNLTDADRRALREPFAGWCAAARKYLASPQTKDDDIDFALVWFEAYNAVPRQHRRLFPELVASVTRELHEADWAVPKDCPRLHSHSLALVLNRLGMRAEPYSCGPDGGRHA